MAPILALTEQLCYACKKYEFRTFFRPPLTAHNRRRFHVPAGACSMAVRKSTNPARLSPLPRVHLSERSEAQRRCLHSDGSSCDRCHAGKRNVVIRPIAEIASGPAARPYARPKGEDARPQHRSCLAGLLPIPIRRAKRNLLDNVRRVHLRSHGETRDPHTISQRARRAEKRKKKRKKEKKKKTKRRAKKKKKQKQINKGERRDIIHMQKV